jgi:riboflavin synthase
VNLIPHTIANTNLEALAAGSRVNIEIDLVARYVERIHSASQATEP